MIHSKSGKAHHVNKFIVSFFLLGFLAWLASYLHAIGVYFVPPDVRLFFRGVFTIAMSFFIASLIVRFTIRYIERSFDKATPAESKILLSKSYQFFWYFLAIVYLLWYFGASFESLTLTIGLFATGIAFAIRDVILAYLVWFILLTKRPFRIGDYIRIGDDEGKVIHMGTFYVVLDDTPNRPEDYTRVPNKTFMEKSIVNLGRDSTRLSILVPLAEPSRAIQSRMNKVRKVAAEYTVFSGPSIMTRGEKVFVSLDVESSPDERVSRHEEIAEKLLIALA